MFFKSIVAVFMLLLLLPAHAWGQICSVSHYPYGFAGSNQPQMHGSKFKAIKGDLPFINEKGRKPRYSQFWVDTAVLSIKSGPGFKYKTTSETYLGNLVFVYAKTGNWVAIKPSRKYNDISVEAEWVHISYLSSQKIDAQLSTDFLNTRCSFSDYGTLDKAKMLNDTYNAVYNACGAVYRYLHHQNLLSTPHPYSEDYIRWREAQSAPLSYNSMLCERRK